MDQVLCREIWIRLKIFLLFWQIFTEVYHLSKSFFYTQQVGMLFYSLNPSEKKITENVIGDDLFPKDAASKIYIRNNASSLSIEDY